MAHELMYLDVDGARADVETERHPAALAVGIDDDVGRELAVNIFISATSHCCNHGIRMTSEPKQTLFYCYENNLHKCIKSCEYISWYLSKNTH